MRDRAELEGLYNAHAASVQAYARRRIDHSTADDVVSEVFVAAWRHLAEIPADPLPWLLGTARRVLANQRRSTERQAALFERMANEPPGTSPSDGPFDGRVLHALARLRASDRELLLLIAWDEVSAGQAAQILGIRPSTLSMRLKRARQRLAHELGTSDGAGEPSTSAPATETTR